MCGKDAAQSEDFLQPAPRRRFNVQRRSHMDEVDLFRRWTVITLPSSQIDDLVVHVESVVVLESFMMLGDLTLMIPDCRLKVAGTLLSAITGYRPTVKRVPASWMGATNIVQEQRRNIIYMQDVKAHATEPIAESPHTWYVQREESLLMYILHKHQLMQTSLQEVA